MEEFKGVVREANGFSPLREQDHVIAIKRGNARYISDHTGMNISKI